jgi:diguanylate cyclase (GGDEF)-like protein
MLRGLLKRAGLIRTTSAVTGLSILASVALTYLVTQYVDGGSSVTAMLIAILVPAVIAPLLSYALLRLLFQLDAAEERMRQLSIKDDLTQVYNRRHFIEHAKVEWERALRYGEEFAIIIFDIDDFKRINDIYGHLAGDEILREVSRVCEKEARASDMFARYGGDEFVYLIPNSGAIDIQELMKRVQQRLSENLMKIGEDEIRITVSMGARRFDDEVPDFEAILSQADQALYTAKRSGGNAVWVSRVG